jgi:hypothetical protein
MPHTAVMVTFIVVAVCLMVTVSFLITLVAGVIIFKRARRGRGAGHHGTRGSGRNWATYSSSSSDGGSGYDWGDSSDHSRGDGSGGGWGGSDSGSSGGWGGGDSGGSSGGGDSGGGGGGGGD